MSVQVICLRGAFAMRAYTYVDESVIGAGPEGVVASHVHAIIAEARLVQSACISGLTCAARLTQC